MERNISLTERWNRRLTSSDNEYKARTGRTLTESKKIMTAQLLENAQKYMNFYATGRINEALDNSIGTQTADIANLKKFVLDVTQVTVPNLIAPEVAMIKVLDARTGYVAYRSYTAGSRKGVRNSDGTFDGRMNVANGRDLYEGNGDILRGTFVNGKPQSEYTSKVVELEAASIPTGGLVLRWTPILPGSIFVSTGAVGSRVIYVDVPNAFTAGFATTGKLYALTEGTDFDAIEKVNVNGKVTRVFTLAGVVVDPTDGTDSGDVTYGSTRDVKSGDMVAAGNGSDVSFFGSITPDAAISGATVEYQYENEYVPQNDIPLVNMKMEYKQIFTKARRIAVYFSQLADFEAQKDYGFNLGEDLRKQAEFQLQYEIDCEVLENIKAIGDANSAAAINWYAIPGIGVNMRDHYETLQVAIAEANAKLFSVTQKFHGTYLLVGPAGLRFFSMMNGFKMLTGTKFGYGPYVAGELGGVKVICTPTITGDEMYLGVNTPEASAVLFGTYMPIVPTQLLQYADGGTSQGWSTLYDVVRLNDNLVAKINVVNAMNPAVLIQAAATPSADQTFTDANGVTWTVAKAGE